MKPHRYRLLLLTLGLSLVACSQSKPTVAPSPDLGQQGEVYVSQSLYNDETGPLTSLTGQSLQRQKTEPRSPATPKQLEKGGSLKSQSITPQTTPSPIAPGAGPQLGKVFEGLSNDDNEALYPFLINPTRPYRPFPPDTVGDVSEKYYVQGTNSGLLVLDKSGNRVAGPVKFDALWEGFKFDGCSLGDGDPLVHYDRQAGRWVISQMRFHIHTLDPSNPVTVPPGSESYQCVAISKTANPLEGFYRYAFQIDKYADNDYGKMGVWTTGYYFTFNMFPPGSRPEEGEDEAALKGQSVAQIGKASLEINPNVDYTQPFVRLMAVNKADMLRGKPAKIIFRDIPNVVETTNSEPGGGYNFSAMPSDLKTVKAPAADTPNTIVIYGFPPYGYKVPVLRLYDFTANFDRPSQSKLGQVSEVVVANYAPALQNAPQPGIPAEKGLDNLGDRLMFHAQYRVFPTYAAIVVNHAVDADGKGQLGVHWYELRNAGLGWTLYQEGVFVDSHLESGGTNTWMAGVGINKLGEIGVGYSLSSNKVFPSIGFTYRTKSDPLGQLRQGQTMALGGNVQNPLIRYVIPDPTKPEVEQVIINRWGDYSVMSVDPSDECTFWYTTEYMSAASDPKQRADWKTVIGSFRSPDCK